jgi:hypothetical protein
MCQANCAPDHRCLLGSERASNEWHGLRRCAWLTLATGCVRHCYDLQIIELRVVERTSTDRKTAGFCNRVNGLFSDNDHLAGSCDCSRPGKNVKGRCCDRIQRSPILWRSFTTLKTNQNEFESIGSANRRVGFSEEPSVRRVYTRGTRAPVHEALIIRKGGSRAAPSRDRLGSSR